MNINKKRFIPYVIVILPLAMALVVAAFITSLYIENITDNFKATKSKYIGEQIDLKKLKSEMWVNHMNLLYDYKYNKLQQNIESELIQKVNIAHKSANSIYKKYKTKKEIQDRIKNLMSNISWNKEKNYVFIKNFSGDTIIKSSLSNTSMDYMDIDGRTIFLEEIHKVRKRGEGFLYSKYAKNEPAEVIYVKKLGIYDWYIGSKIFKKQKIDELKISILDTIKSIPIEKSDFISLVDSKSLIFLSPTIKNKLPNESLQKTLTQETGWNKKDESGYYYYSKYYKPLDLYTVYGFEINSKSKKELEKQNQLIKKLDDEFQLIMKISIPAIILVVILSLILARKRF